MPLTTLQALAESAAPFGRVLEDTAVGEVVFGRDRSDGHGALATIRPAGRDRSYIAYTVHMNSGSGWNEDPEFEHGDPWPISPTAPRPAGSGFEFLGSVGGRLSSEAGPSFAVCVGIARLQVATVMVESPIDRHPVELDSSRGWFVALCMLDRTTAVDLVAHDERGEAIHRVSVALPGPMA